jgi:hypothetical protein
MQESSWNSPGYGRPTRRCFAQLGAAGAAVWKAPLLAAEGPTAHPALRDAVAMMQYFTRVEEIKTVLDMG